MRNPLYLALLYVSGAIAQPGIPVILNIEIDDHVEYFSDTTDVMKLGTEPDRTKPLLPNTFFNVNHLADIISINGQPAKGVLVQAVRVYGLTATPTPTRPIADVTRPSMRTQYFEILTADGNPIGAIVVIGMAGADALAIVGGTGVFLGARGFLKQVGRVRPARFASASEDPSRRRHLGGGRSTQRLVVYPMLYPQIESSNGVHAIVHGSNSAPITAVNPAASGEVVSMMVTNLGPTRPAVEPGEPFPASPPARVNAPVEVHVGGKKAEVLAAIGRPGSIDGFQVRFRMPEAVPAGEAQVQISTAWMKGAAVTIQVR